MDTACGSGNFLTETYISLRKLKNEALSDGGHLLLSDDEYSDIIQTEPNSKKYIRKFLGAREYLHNIPRWCIWLVNVNLSEINKLSEIKKRVVAVKEFRLSSTKAATQKFADYPTRFMELRQPETDYILIPRHSSENRKYIPFGFMKPDSICGDANNMIPNATLYHFGVLTSKTAAAEHHKRCPVAAVLFTMCSCTTPSCTSIPQSPVYTHSVPTSPFLFR